MKTTAPFECGSPGGRGRARSPVSTDPGHGDGQVDSCTAAGAMLIVRPSSANSSPTLRSTGQADIQDRLAGLRGPRSSTTLAYNFHNQSRSRAVPGDRPEEVRFDRCQERSGPTLPRRL